MDEDLHNLIYFLCGLAFFSHIGSFVLGLVIGRNYSTLAGKSTPTKASIKTITTVIVPPDTSPAVKRTSTRYTPGVYRSGRKLLIPL